MSTRMERSGLFRTRSAINLYKRLSKRFVLLFFFCSTDISTTTVSTTTINDARCNLICMSRRSVPRAQCPSCSFDAHYGQGYYCCGGNTAASCGGRFTDAGNTCACNGDHCIKYDGGCGYFDYVDFDTECRCFFC